MIFSLLYLLSLSVRLCVLLHNVNLYIITFWTNTYEWKNNKHGYKTVALVVTLSAQVLNGIRKLPQSFHQMKLAIFES